MASFGETLKRERELREISLRQISEATKINIRYLEALEENRFDALPGGLFNKGFIRAYARYVGLDGEAMVDAYLHEVSGRQTGAEIASSRGSSPLHRPHEVPQRRAAPSSAAPDRPIVSDISQAARRIQDARASSARPSIQPERAPSAAERLATLAAVERSLEHAARPTVAGVEAAGPQGPGSSRVLVWVLSLVAGAGVLFLIVSLVRGTSPAPQRTPDGPAAPGVAAPALPESGAPAPTPENHVEPSAEEELVVIPEAAAQSPLTLGAAGTPPAKTPPAERPAAAPPRPAPVKTPPSPPAEVAPSATRSAEGPRQEVTRPAEEALRVSVEARNRVYVVLVCDGRQVVSRMMEAGETERARCSTVIRVSASDAGAVGLSVNGVACLPLGDPGTRAYGYTIRIDDHDRICPPGAGGQNGRP